jgi:large subunit ribosomal protein L4
MELKVINKEGKETSTKVVLNKDIYGIEPNDHAIYLDVKQYLANQRQGTHSSKENWYFCWRCPYTRTTSA